MGGGIGASIYSDRGGDLWTTNILLAFCFVPTARNAHITTSSDMNPFLGTDGHTFSRPRPGSFPQATRDLLLYPTENEAFFFDILQPGASYVELLDMGFTLDAPTGVVGIPQYKDG